MQRIRETVSENEFGAADSMQIPTTPAAVSFIDSMLVSGETDEGVQWNEIEDSILEECLNNSSFDFDFFAVKGQGS